MSDPRDPGQAPDGTSDDALPGGDLLGDADGADLENLQSSTGGGMGPESFPPEDDEDYSGNGAGRGPA